MYKDNLINNLHKVSRNDPVTIELMKATGISFDSIGYDINDLMTQLNIDTATWGLAVYEKELGIKTNQTQDYETRRSIIKAKLRGSGKLDATKIKIVADAWANGSCRVEFDGKINISFDSIYGVPKNLIDLQNALEDVKPAHIALVYNFIYLLIKDIHNVMTINEIQAKKLSEFAGGVLSG
ncbi:putative phage tail protein [Wukongibacter sp. M2B1]|uniref:putative phage tail protein n=1 Tax=Wukongibacter sp. M2B1 TaxID=3088895 RepID=UPI003D7C0FEB